MTTSWLLHHWCDLRDAYYSFAAKARDENPRLPWFLPNAMLAHLHWCSQLCIPSSRSWGITYRSLSLLMMTCNINGNQPSLTMAIHGASPLVNAPRQSMPGAAVFEDLPVHRQTTIVLVEAIETWVQPGYSFPLIVIRMMIVHAGDASWYRKTST